MTECWRLHSMVPHKQTVGVLVKAIERHQGTVAKFKNMVGDGQALLWIDFPTEALAIAFRMDSEPGLLGFTTKPLRMFSAG